VRALEWKTQKERAMKVSGLAARWEGERPQGARSCTIARIGFFLDDSFEEEYACWDPKGGEL